MLSSLLIIVPAIALWGAVHSWLALPGVKDRVQTGRYYRLLYNLISVVTFVPILLLVGLLPDRILYSVQPPFAYIMVLGQIAAVTGLLVAVWQTDALGLLGLRQLMGQKENTAFVTGGLYRYVRHPMYFFGLLILWLTPLMTVNVLAAWLGLSVYVLVGAHYEEKKLSRLYGSAYEEYRARTPMIVPLPRLGHKPT